METPGIPTEEFLEKIEQAVSVLGKPRERTIQATRTQSFSPAVGFAMFCKTASLPGGVLVGSTSLKQELACDAAQDDECGEVAKAGGLRRGCKADFWDGTGKLHVSVTLQPFPLTWDCLEHCGMARC